MTPTNSIARSLAQRLQKETRTLYSLENVAELVHEYEELARMSQELFQAGQYEAGITHVQREPTYLHNAIAQGQAGLGFAYMRQYDEARRCLRNAVALSSDLHVQAHYMALLATTFLEEWELDAAEQHYREVLSLQSTHIVALAGCLAVACQRQEAHAVERAVQDLREQHPDWRTNQSLVATLFHDRLFRFLREHMDVFEREGKIPACDEKNCNNTSQNSTELLERLAELCERQERSATTLKDAISQSRQEVLEQLELHRTTCRAELAALRADITALHQGQRELEATLTALLSRLPQLSWPQIPLMSDHELRARISEASSREDEDSLRKVWELLSLKKFYEGNPTGLRELAESSHLSHEQIYQWIQVALMRCEVDCDSCSELLEVLLGVTEYEYR
jgi:hypothetical protein